MTTAQTTTRRTLSVDLTEIGRKDTRERLRESVDASGYELSDFPDFWDHFLTDGPATRPSHTLVVGDLSRFAKHYRAKGAHGWIASVRRMRPLFLALVRTRRDERLAALIDDLLRASDLRMIVCRETQADSELEHCLAEALQALEPDSLLELRYSPVRDDLWVQFGDGFSGTVDWSSLGIEDLRGELVAESASIGEIGRTLEMSKTDGDLFEVDSASIRAVLDREFRRSLNEQTADANETVGVWLRKAREGAALTQVALSERTGIDQAVISRLETGKQRPRIDTLRRISGALDLTLSELLGGVQD